jgi:hypothetical protein
MAAGAEAVQAWLKVHGGLRPTRKARRGEDTVTVAEAIAISGKGPAAFTSTSEPSEGCDHSWERNGRLSLAVPPSLYVEDSLAIQGDHG